MPPLLDDHAIHARPQLVAQILDIVIVKRFRVTQHGNLDSELVHFLRSHGGKARITACCPCGILLNVQDQRAPSLKRPDATTKMTAFVQRDEARPLAPKGLGDTFHINNWRIMPLGGMGDRLSRQVEQIRLILS
jgi:hypothetical protein